MSVSVSAPENSARPSTCFRKGVSGNPHGRPTRVPGAVSRKKVGFMCTESEHEELLEEARYNGHSIGDFIRTAVNTAVQESRERRGPLVLFERRQADRRQRPGNDLPVELERRKGPRRQG